jgi:DnaJ-class molecular chaperone
MNFARYQKKDYYKLLGVDRNASFDEIKRAYRRTVIKSHPDKVGANPNTNNNATIYDINEAYTILRDPEQKKKYDNEIDYGFTNDYINPIDIIILVTKFMKTINDALNSFPHKSKPDIKPEPEPDIKPKPDININLDIKLKIDVSLEDLYCKKIKKLIITRKRKGEYEKKLLYISLLNYESKYIFPNQGDEDDENNSIGDVIVFINIKEHNVFVLDTLIDKYDLWMEMDINLYDYYYGKTIRFKTLDNTDFSFRMDKFNQYSMVHLLKGMGLPYYDENKDDELSGDLYISFKVKLKDLDDDILEKEDVENILDKFLS